MERLHELAHEPRWLPLEGDAALVAKAWQELARYQHGDLTDEELHNVCHHRTTVTAQDFADGCAEWQRGIYQKAPDRDWRDALVTRLSELCRLVSEAEARGLTALDLATTQEVERSRAALAAERDDVPMQAVGGVRDAVVRCLDCGLRYDRFGLDLLLPTSQWRAIVPEAGWLLCATCIMRRLARALPGATVVHAVAEVNPASAQSVAIADLASAARKVLTPESVASLAAALTEGAARAGVQP